MESAWSGNMLSSGRKKAIEELGRGRELTNQLREDLLSKSVGDKGLVGGEDLVIKIINSFANTLSMLRNYDSDALVSKNPNNNIIMEKSWDVDRKSQGLGESINITTKKERRGCYKRRKCANSWTRDTPTLMDDGHVWRKYGQKAILHANHPRHYFRCTHKIDQGCEATKQVQKIGDNPPKYRTTYYGHHTCKNPLNTSHDQLIQLDDSTSNNDSSILISFANKHDNPFISSFPSIKQESKEDHAPRDITHNRSSSSTENLFSPDQMRTFESFAPTTVFSADHSRDVIFGMLDDLDQLLEF